MCGRVFQNHNLQRLIQIARTSNVRNVSFHNPNFNTAPTSYIPAVRQRMAAPVPSSDQSPEEHISQERDDLELDFLKWGYDAGFAFVINARIEEMQEKRMFKNLLNSNRCAVIVEGYYEWNEKKEAFSFRPKGPTDHFFIAALTFNNDTVILLTRPAVKALEFVHHRMPVLLEGKELDMWMDHGKNSFCEIIDRYILNEKNKVWENISCERIGPLVNDVKNKSPKCLLSYADYMKELDQKGIKRFFKPKEPAPSEKGQEQKPELKLKEPSTEQKPPTSEKNEDKEKSRAQEKSVRPPNKAKSPLKTLKTPSKRKQTETEKLEGKKRSQTLTKAKAAVQEDADVLNALKAFIKN